MYSHKSYLELLKDILLHPGKKQVGNDGCNRIIESQAFDTGHLTSILYGNRPQKSSHKNPPGKNPPGQKSPGTKIPPTKSPRDKIPPRDKISPVG